MGRNFVGIEVPVEVEAKAKEHGCVGGVLFVYRDREYGGRTPRASIGCTQATPFRSNNCEKYKVELISGWVAFRSPASVSRQPNQPPKRNLGKSLCTPCLICGEDRYTEEAHFPTPDRHGGTETIPLFPTHHRLLDNGRLSDWEFMEIYRKRHSHLGHSGVGEFIAWAYSQKYPYSLADIASKALRKQSASARQVSYRIENVSSTDSLSDDKCV